MQQNFSPVDDLSVSKKVVEEERTLGVNCATDTSAVICAVWRNVLSLSEISPNDNYFSLGGNSILALRIVADIKDIGLSIEVADLFRFQTVSELSRILESRVDQKV